MALSFGSASAQTYPAKPVRVVVTTVPGPLDAFARVVLQQVEKRLKQTFIIDNRAGAGGNLGADIVAKAPADGYTLLFALDTTFTVNPSLYRKMPFDVAKDFAIISVPVTYSQALAVNPNVKANSVAEFVKLAKSKHMSYASGGNGSPSHLTMAAFMATAGIEMTHVPYKGTGASVIDVMAGQVDSVFAVGSGILPQAKAGKLRALAVSGVTRSAAGTRAADDRRERLSRLQRQLRLRPRRARGHARRDRAAAGARGGPGDGHAGSARPEPPGRLRGDQPTQAQSGAWLAEMREHWSEVVAEVGHHDRLIVRRTDDMRHIDDALVDELIGPLDAQQALLEAFRSFGKGRAEMQERMRTESGGVKLSTLGAVMPDQGFAGAKVYTTIAGQFRFVILLFDAAVGRPLASFDAGAITRLRTAATSVIASRYLARANAKTMALFGAGVQGREHAQQMAAAYRLTELRVCDPFATAEVFADLERRCGVAVRRCDSADEAIAGVDIVVTASRSKTSLFDGDRLPKGAFVAAIGSSLPDTRELDDRALARATVVAVDWRLQAEKEAGDLVLADPSALPAGKVVQLCDLITGAARGRRSDDDITIFKSVGVGLQDVALAGLVWQRFAETSPLDCARL